MKLLMFFNFIYNNILICILGKKLPRCAVVHEVHLPRCAVVYQVHQIPRFTLSVLEFTRLSVFILLRVLSCKT